MKKFHAISIFAILVFAISFSIHEVYAAPAITVTPSSGPVNSTATVSGHGFIAEAGFTVFVFFDNKLVDSVRVANDGSFTIAFPIPPSGLGSHTIYISLSPITHGGMFLLTSTSFTVTKHVSIPEFPFSFNLVIIFVAVTAVYLAIRQKMTANLKPF